MTIKVEVKSSMVRGPENKIYYHCLFNYFNNATRIAPWTTLNFSRPQPATDDGVPHVENVQLHAEDTVANYRHAHCHHTLHSHTQSHPPMHYSYTHSHSHTVRAVDTVIQSAGSPFPQVYHRRPTEDNC